DGVLTAAVDRAQERIETLLSRSGRNHAEIRSKVQKTMTDNVNVFREEPGLKETLGDLREAREQYQDVAVSDPSRTFNTDLIHTMETRNILDIAEALTMGALARREFRGAHWRKENQIRDDENWLKHTLVSWNDGEPELWYKPVILEGENKEYEPKNRSY
ncbi:succinate dehydrogenase, partial [Halorubrum pallidum]